MNQSRTVSMLLALSALTLIAGAALMETHGVVLFVIGFAAGWLTSAAWHRRQRSSSQGAT